VKTCYDPEIPVNIYELGLIYELNITPDRNAEVIMTLTSPFCPVAGTLPEEVRQKIQAVEGINEATLDVVFDPPWDKEMMSEEAKLQLGFM
ncbi:MAG TPA: iron-sulfur cluster assembly protein, partial [Anseongella sp.]|nr:iron-sulfur cluster assembly protein [Anseongella sp.]